MKKLLLALTLALGFTLPLTAQETAPCDGPAMAKVGAVVDGRISLSMRLWNEDGSRAMDLRLRLDADGRAVARVRSTAGLTTAVGRWTLDREGLFAFQLIVDGQPIRVELSATPERGLRGCWGFDAPPPLED